MSLWSAPFFRFSVTAGKGEVPTRHPSTSRARGPNQSYPRERLFKTRKTGKGRAVFERVANGGGLVTDRAERRISIATGFHEDA